MTVRTMTNTVRRREVRENVRREVRVGRRRRRSRSRIEKDIGDSGDNNMERTVRTEEDSGKDTPSIHCETQCFSHT